MILTYNQLLKMVTVGQIEDVPEENINGASIDLTLGGVFYREKNPTGTGIIDLSQKETPNMELEVGTFYLGPGEFCLAQTEQVFHLPDDIAGHFMLKSSQARAGLQHLFAGFADPTWNGSVLTLEFYNSLKYHTLVLRPGMKAGQMVFFKGTSSVPQNKSYAVRGQYNNNQTTQPSKGMR